MEMGRYIFSRDAVKWEKMTPMRIYNSLDIFNTFIYFLTKTQKKQIIQQLSDWKNKNCF